MDDASSAERDWAQEFEDIKAQREKHFRRSAAAVFGAISSRNPLDSTGNIMRSYEVSIIRFGHEFLKAHEPDIMKGDRDRENVFMQQALEIDRSYDDIMEDRRKIPIIDERMSARLGGPFLASVAGLLAGLPAALTAYGHIAKAAFIPVLVGTPIAAGILQSIRTKKMTHDIYESNRITPEDVKRLKNQSAVSDQTYYSQYRDMKSGTMQTMYDATTYIRAAGIMKALRFNSADVTHDLKLYEGPTEHLALGSIAQSDNDSVDIAERMLTSAIKLKQKNAL